MKRAVVILAAGACALALAACGAEPVSQDFDTLVTQAGLDEAAARLDAQSPAPVYRDAVANGSQVNAAEPQVKRTPKEAAEAAAREARVKSRVDDLKARSGRTDTGRRTQRP